MRSNVSGSNVVTLQVHADLWTTESESSAPPTEYMTSFARTSPRADPTISRVFDRDGDAGV